VQKLRPCVPRHRNLARSLSVVSAAEQHENDIVIVGGGPAGLALAAALGSSKRIRESLRVTLVEAGDLSKVRQWRQPEGTYSNRVSSLTNSSRAFLHGEHPQSMAVPVRHPLT